IVVGLVVGGWFLHRQRTLPDPLLDLSLFANRAFSMALGTYMFSILFVFGTFYFTAQYLQLVLGMSPLSAGLWSLPSALAFVVGSNLVSRIVLWVRPGVIVTVGLALAAVGFVVLTRVGVASLPLLIGGTLIMSLGLAPVITLATDVIVGSAPPERAGAASGVSETSAEFGGALGIAILGSLGVAVYRDQVIRTLPADLPPDAVAAARETLGGAVLAAEQLPAPIAAALLRSARVAFVQGLHITAVVGAIALAGMAALAAILMQDIESGTGFQEKEDMNAGGPGISDPGASEILDPAA
ncbi:MAG TPA: MFS transporter, partial [Thermomicrobiales bacterium]|nr:MFS transporter [Thermomicrobiales bacterium]